MSNIYVMAHRSNTKYWVDKAIEWKANCIECDVTRYKGEYYTWHGDAGGSEPLDVYLEHACRQLIEGDGRKVSLFIFDLKYDWRDRLNVSDIDVIRKRVREKLLDPINAGSAAAPGGFYVFYCTYEGEAYAGKLMESFSNYAPADREGVNFDSNREVWPEAALKWREDNKIANFIYSAGIYAGGTSRTMWKQLKKAGELRSDTEFGVYGWTFGRAQSAADSVKQYRLDGVLGNVNQNFGWLPTNFEYYGLGSYGMVSRQDVPPFLKTIAS